MSKFNLTASIESMAEAIVTMKGAETARILLNHELRECHKAKVKWKEIRDSLAGPEGWNSASHSEHDQMVLRATSGTRNLHKVSDD